MITNEKQYRTSKKQLQHLQSAFQQADHHSQNLPVQLREAMKAGIQSKMDDIQAEVATYESLKEEEHVLVVHTIAELPKILIQARIMRGYTQKKLASLLHMKEQLLQRYESENYRSVKLERLIHISEVLGVQIEGAVTLQR